MTRRARLRHPTAVLSGFVVSTVLTTLALDDRGWRSWLIGLAAAVVAEISTKPRWVERRIDRRRQRVGPLVDATAQQCEQSGPNPTAAG